MAKILRYYIVLGLLLYSILFVFWGNNILSFYNVVNIIFFVCFSLLLYVSYFQRKDFYTKVKLFLTVLLFSLFGVGLYCYMSCYYSGNTFLFSRVDALVYFKMSNKLAISNFNYWYEILTSRGWGFDDWGAPVGMSFFYMIWPTKASLNIGFVVLTSIAAVSMYDMAKTIMMKRYAYMAALIYS